MQTTAYISTLFDGESNLSKVTVAFTMAKNAVIKGHSAMVIFMADAVTLGLPNATDGMDIGKPFDSVKTLLEDYVNKGGRIAICSSCMIHHGLSAEQMDPRYEIITASDVIDLVMNATGSLQIT